MLESTTALSSRQLEAVVGMREVVLMVGEMLG